MNSAQLHLALNHAPLFGLGFGLLVLLYGMLRKNADVLRAGLLLFVLAALLAVPAYLSGDGAEEVIEHMPGIAKSLIETHEEAATVALIVVIAAGLAAMAGLHFLHRKRPLPKLVTAAILILALAALGVIGYAASLGGKIQHAELRAGFVVPAEHDDEGD